MKARIAEALRALADKLATPEEPKIVEPVSAPDIEDDSAWMVPGPVVVLSREAEEMLAQARAQAPKEKEAPEGPAEGSAWYRYLMASARRENGS